MVTLWGFVHILKSYTILMTQCLAQKVKFRDFFGQQYNLDLFSNRKLNFNSVNTITMSGFLISS